MSSRRSFIKQAAAAGMQTLALAAGTEAHAFKEAAPIRLAIVGLRHDHVLGMLSQLLGRADYQLVGIVEPDGALAAKYEHRFGLDRALFFTSIGDMLSGERVDAVAIFTPPRDHRRVVEECARAGLHVMMEKPFATSTGDARAMMSAAARANIRLVINYDVTWYPSTRLAYDLVHGRGDLGRVRKLLIRQGNRGPAKEGCSTYFVDWLSDPQQNEGALSDFGCYGVNLATWLMRGERPRSVSAVTQSFQPNLYPRVNDDATIVLAYPTAQAIVEASWNWPSPRKDMEIYCETGHVAQVDPRRVIYRPTPSAERDTRQSILAGPDRDLRPALVVMAKARAQSATAPAAPDSPVQAPDLGGPEKDVLAYFAAVVREGRVPSGLSSMEMNAVVVEVIEAASQSARTGRRVDLLEHDGIARRESCS